MNGSVSGGNGSAPASNGSARADNGSAPAVNGNMPAGALVTTCPRCATRYGANAFVQEYWAGARRIFTCWCAACQFVCDIAVVDRVYSYEPEH